MEEVVRKSTATSKDELEEKIIQKLQNALVYREEQLEKLKEKIREHVRNKRIVLVKKPIFVVI